jgi:Ca-activated chloride channel family protein
MRRTLGWAAAGWMAAGATAQAGGPALPRFGSEVEVVTVNVAVTDPRTRGFVSGLHAGSFLVLEDGIPQRLCLFEQERMPIEVTLLLDSSNSMAPRLPAVKAAARRLVRTLRPEDQAEVYHFNQRLELAQPLTSDQGALEQAIDALAADGATGLFNAVYMSIKGAEARKAGQDPRRRAVVVLTDGADTSSLVTDDQVLQLARKSELTVYAINLAETRRVADPADMRGVHFLAALTRDTGGRAFFPKALAELEGVYATIADELRTQYTLGYVSSNERRDGAWRAVAVQTTGRGSILRHRAGYYAPRDRARGTLLSSLLERGPR